MSLPFTPDQFFSIFAEYNRSFWMVVVVLWFATIAALVLTWRQPERWSPALSTFLGAVWLWNAVAYHAFLFTRINPAARVFSLMFALQAVVFVHDGLRRRAVYLASTGVRQIVGAALAAYSLAYPFVTTASGHDYPAAPTYGLPCPTAILTIGILLTAREGIRWRVAAIPIVWGFIGGSAAMLLQVQTDYVLLAAGVLLLAVLLAQGVRQRRIST